MAGVPNIVDLTSLLGRDVLNRWRMDRIPTLDHLTFNVISADIAAPIHL